MKKRVLVLMLALCMVFTMMFVPTVAASSTTGDDYSGCIIILHSNDVHGEVDGYAYMAGLKNYFEQRNAKVILVDAGDYSQGSPYVSVSKGATAIELMNAVGYDVATIGNHELDYGFEQLKSNVEEADFDVLCADVFDSNGDTIFKANTIIEKEGVKIGFFGLETPEAQTKANPALIKGLTFVAGQELYNVAQAQIDELKSKGADVVVCISHLGVDNESEPNRSYDLYNNTTGIDVVIDAHSHTVMLNGKNGEPIQSTGTAFSNVGAIVIETDTKKIENKHLIELKLKNDKEEYTDFNIDLFYLIDETRNGNKEVNDTIARIKKDIDDLYGVKFAETTVVLNGAKDPGVRTEETNLGDLITDSMLWKATKEEGSIKVDVDNIVAVTNGGGIRATINVGDITRKDVNTVLPFGNTIAVVYVKGSELLEAIEASTYSTPGAVGGFPQISGMQIEIDTTRPYDANDTEYPGSTYFGPKTINRVTIRSINGKAFDEDEVYAVVTNNFLAAGGDTYYAFASASEQFDTGIPMDEALMEYIDEVLDGEITEETYGAPAGRIAVVTSHNISSEPIGAVDCDCENDGHIAFYPCFDPGCDAKFADPEGNVKYKESEVVIPATGHTISSELVEAADADCENDGHIAYYRCLDDGCDAKFADPDGKVKYEDSDIVIPATGHKDADNDGVCDVCKEKMSNTSDSATDDEPDASVPVTGDVTDNTVVVMFIFAALSAVYLYNYDKKKKTVNVK